MMSYLQTFTGMISHGPSPDRDSPNKQKVSPRRALFRPGSAFQPSRAQHFRKEAGTRPQGAPPVAEPFTLAEGSLPKNVQMGPFKPWRDRPRPEMCLQALLDPLRSVQPLRSSLMQKLGPLRWEGA